MNSLAGEEEGAEDEERQSRTDIFVHQQASLCAPSINLKAEKRI